MSSDNLEKAYSFNDGVSIPDMSDDLYEKATIGRYKGGNISIEINTYDMKHPLMLTVDAPFMSNYPNAIAFDIDNIQLRYLNKIGFELVKLGIMSALIGQEPSKKGKKYPIYGLNEDFLNNRKRKVVIAKMIIHGTEEPLFKVLSNIAKTYHKRIGEPNIYFDWVDGKHQTAMSVTINYPGPKYIRYLNLNNGKTLGIVENAPKPYNTYEYLDDEMKDFLTQMVNCIDQWWNSLPDVPQQIYVK